MDSDLLVCAGMAGPLASVSCLFPLPTPRPADKSAGLPCSQGCCLLPPPRSHHWPVHHLPLCIMEQNVPKATYSSFAT